MPTNAQLISARAGTPALVVPPFPKLKLPEKIAKAFPDFNDSVERHHREVEEWRKNLQQSIMDRTLT